MSTVTLQSPYQKLGYKVPAGTTALQALKDAGMTGWNQRLLQPLVMDGGEEFDVGKFRFNVANLPTGPKVLGAVQATYRPIDIETAFVPIMDGFAGEGLTPIVVGAYDDGKAAFIQFSLPAGTKLKTGEEIGTTVLITKRNDGKGAVLGFPTMERLFCANQIPNITRNKIPLVNVRHTKNSDPAVAATVERLLGITQDWDDAISEQIEVLQGIAMSKKDFVDSFVPKLLGDRPEDKGRSQTMFDNAFESLVATWHSPVAVEESSAWKSLNVVTEWEQHHRLIPNDRNEVRMARAVLTGRQPHTARALELLGV